MTYLLAVLLILGFTFMSGFNDGGNLLATFLNTRTMNVVVVLLIILLMLMAGPLIVGTAVAQTISTQIINIQKVGIGTLNIALLATLLTLFLSWKMRVPTSTSFALIGGMSGAALTVFGASAVVWMGLVKVVVSLILAVLLGGLVGFLVYSGLLLILRRVSVRFGVKMAYTQYVSAGLVSFGYGSNDAEKSIGLLATVWMLMHHSQFHVIWWMIFLPIVIFVLGLVWGGWRVAKTIGFHVFHARPVHSLSTQLSTAIVVLAAAAFGGPVSTTQTIDSALIGVGARAGKERVRWGVVRRMCMVWVFTMPTAFILSVLLALILKVGVLL